MDYYSYWGKAKNNNDGARDYHLLVYHSLDVAAVGYEFIKRRRIFRERISLLTGMEEKELERWIPFFLALHDIGKFANSFQNLCPDILLELQGKNSNRKYCTRHDSSGLTLWHRSLYKHFQKKGIILESSDDSFFESYNSGDEPIEFWINSSVGHHGQPANTDSIRRLPDEFDNDDISASLDFTDEIINIFLSGNCQLPDLNNEEMKISSWWLAGLAVFSDWLGSNTNFFPYKKSISDLKEYWEREAKPRAQKAIDESGMSGCLIRENLQFSDIFKEFNDGSISPTGLQSAIAKLNISREPTFFILEDVTGSGKTEAAILLASKMMGSGCADGIYFALPTMATSNTMYERMKKAYRSLYAPNSTPSLVLAHGQRKMVQSFRETISPSAEDMKKYSDGLSTATSHCNSWLADNGKKSLLADMGVGTIDQALLSILPSRHQSLRLLGLVGKIILVDEVHACDEYMQKLLCKLLYAHAKTGGSAIFLSATLAKKQRQSFIDAYTKGVDENNCNTAKSGNYPLLTGFNKTDGLKEYPVSTTSRTRKKVSIKFLSQEDSVYTLVKEKAEKSRCVCWIRNTVKDAIAAYQKLCEDINSDNILLFHSRYILEDRLSMENRIIKYFGKNSNQKDRSGKILIATQVVEQSLDLDFDFLVTDLAPIDLLIQRAGRLCRHSRDIAGNPIKAPDVRGVPCLYIHGPEYDPEPEENWFSQTFPNAGYVYRDHFRLWLTRKVLAEKKEIVIPEDSRYLIESVYGDDVQYPPPGLKGRSQEAEADNISARGQASINALPLEHGYKKWTVDLWWDEGITPTRTGEPSCKVYLAKWDTEKLSSMGESWPKSMISIPSYWIKKARCANPKIPERIYDQCVKDIADGWSLLLPMIWNKGNKMWSGQAYGEKDKKYQFFYSQSIGLLIKSLAQRN